MRTLTLSLLAALASSPTSAAALFIPEFEEVAIVDVYNPDPTRAMTTTWRTIDLLATSGRDYHAATGQLSWPAGDTSARQVGIALIDDALGEPVEYFLVYFGDGQSRFDPSPTTIVLLDDEPPRIFDSGFDGGAPKLIRHDPTCPAPPAAGAP